MPMLVNKLADGLKNMPLTESESEAARSLADAWTGYFYDASAPGPAVPGSLEAAKQAMVGALSGMSAAGAGATAIQNGITAFWGVVAGAAGSIWPGALSATPPPGVAGIGAAIQAVAPANVAGKLDAEAATKVVAGVIHPLNLGGMVVMPPPAPPVPIL